MTDPEDPVEISNGPGHGQISIAKFAQEVVNEIAGLRDRVAELERRADVGDDYRAERNERR